MRAVALLLIGLIFAGCSDPEAEIIASAREQVAAELRDPTSAQFRNIAVHGADSPSTARICGEVNGANAYGGMAGYQRFVVMPGAEPAIEGSGDTGMAEFDQCLFNQRWAFACAGDGLREIRNVRECMALVPD